MKRNDSVTLSGFLVYLFVLVCSNVSCTKDDKYVRIALDAKWKQTPLHLEAAEFIAEKKQSLFWEFVNEIQGLDKKIQKENYDLVLEKSSKVLSNMEVQVLKFSLSVRSYSARVQLFQQIASEHAMDCKIFFQSSDGKLTCKLEEIALNTQDDKIPPLQVQSFEAF